jgi:hypothetical protein
MINKLAKASCLIVYLLALAGLAGLLPLDVAGRVINIALAMLFIHALELAFAFKYVRRYRGPLAVSVLLTMLFGLMHWMPLVKRHD